VYERLRLLAKKQMGLERPGQTLQPTGLVHEAFLKLMGAGADRRWDNRWHFYAAAAEAMRRILVDAARRHRRLKRGGGLHRVDLDDLRAGVEQPPDDLLAVDEALTRFASQYPQKAELVKLRYFGGLTIDEAAKALGISAATAERQWTFARAWLYRCIAGDDRPGGLSRH
jgi:RNA polymerase sigma factor (TIGR02999 family)